MSTLTNKSNRVPSQDHSMVSIKNPTNSSLMGNSKLLGQRSSSVMATKNRTNNEMSKIMEEI